LLFLFPFLPFVELIVFFVPFPCLINDLQIINPI
jgi:hypothetical protein